MLFNKLGRQGPAKGLKELRDIDRLQFFLDYLHNPVELLAALLELTEDVLVYIAFVQA